MARTTRLEWNEWVKNKRTKFKSKQKMYMEPKKAMSKINEDRNVIQKQVSHPFLPVKIT